LFSGLCLIINNQKFSNTSLDREGSTEDEKDLKKLWESFGCKVEVLRDRVRVDMNVTGVARFVGKNIPNNHKIYLIAVKYT
jgi:hypothetical protein